ncbi:MAG: bifunctional nicotinamidase/pyrazinamidase [Acidimicrobiia bacterium]|nr:bifunctional nicotinamidase/pyrazinamidase [Acidimicrobiia bacterium]
MSDTTPGSAAGLRALIVIDVQNDFCPGGALAVADGDAVVPVANELLSDADAFDVRVLTQDWHPPDHLSFAVNNPGHEPYEVIEVSYGPQVLWPPHCVQGSDGAAFHPDLATDRADMIVRKGFRPAVDSYSAFFENDQTTPTGLDGYLRARGVESLTMVGLATDFCVRYSAVGGAGLGYDVTVALDGCRAIDLDGSLDGALAEMASAGVNVTG